MSNDRPNIVFILTDDQGPWAMRCAGNTELHTPNLDRLAAEGMRFDHFFCTSPVCSPARASLLTGRLPSQHGVHDFLAAGNTSDRSLEPSRNGELIEYLAGIPGYTDALAAAGYTCGLSGKWHLGDAHHPQKGLSFWRVHAKGGGPYYNAPMVQGDKVVAEKRYVTDAITDNALDFLDAHGRAATPFYLGVHYTAPHSPWDREQHPREYYDRYFNDCPFASVPPIMPPPDWVHRCVEPAMSEERRRGLLAGYFAAVTAMDQNVGRLLDWLEKEGLREKTLVVFTSDNGMNMGHHGLWGKGNASFPLNMFEESVRVPFMVSQPGVVPAGRLCSAMLSQYDFMPTLLDFVGLDSAVTDNLPGRSYAALWHGAEQEGREQVVVFDEYGPVRMVRTRDWKYVHRYPYGPHELYDLAADPGETQNRVDAPDCQTIRRELRQRLRDWFAHYVDPARDGVYEGVSGAGQIGLCGRRSEGGTAFSYPHGRPRQRPEQQA